MSRNQRGPTTSDIGQWVDNDEGLYRWWRQSRLSKREFIRLNRSELVRIISTIISGEKRGHYLLYG